MIRRTARTILFALTALALFAAPAAAEVPKFDLKFYDRVGAAQYSTFQDKVLLSLIPEKRVAIYGNLDGILVVSEPPTPPDKTRYAVEATRNGVVQIHYYLDPDMRGDRPQPFKDRKREAQYDKRTVKVELPFTLKHREKSVVWLNGRLEVWLPTSGSNDLKKAYRRGKFLK